VALVYDPAMLAHASSKPHPERPNRIRAIHQHLAAAGLSQRCTALAARRATEEELLLVHR
jgi:acetoin utilization deacetylase AcuC-like enzyme